MSVKAKELREEAAAAKADRKAAAAAEEDKKSRKFRRNTIIAVVVIVIVIIAAALINSNLFYTVVPAVTVDGESYTATEFNYYYKSAFSSFYNTYSSYISYILDTSTPLDEQVCTFSDADYEYTWADYFSDAAKTTLSQTTALLRQAEAEGYDFSGVDYSAIDEAVAEFQSAADTYGYSLNGYLAVYYGKGMNEARLRTIMTDYINATAYGESIYDGFTYTEDELKAYYPEIADTYDTITYDIYYVSTSLDKYADAADDDAALEAVKADAQTVIDCTSEEEFVANVEALLSEEELASFSGADSVQSSTQAGSLSSYYSDWLLDADRQEGDTTVVDVTYGSYAIRYIGRDNNDYNMVNIRHILCAAEADEDGNYTDDAKAVAEEKANLLLRMWLEDPTEEYFAEIATNNSDDSGSVANGGLYENVYKGEMVDTFEDWCFAEHEPGDYGVVYGESSSYCGYHIIYFVGEGQNYADYLSEATMRSNDYSDYISALTENYEVKNAFAWHFTNRT